LLLRTMLRKPPERLYKVLQDLKKAVTSGGDKGSKGIAV
jgi:hypothetical protein